MKNTGLNEAVLINIKNQYFDFLEKRIIERQFQSHFFHIAELLPGSCFGIGESLDKKFILANSHTVTVLCIPKFFLKMHNAGNIWGRVRALYNHTYPSAQTIFSQFLTNRQWNRSRAKYLESLIKLDRPFTGLTCAEAPYYIRLTTDLDNPAFRRIKKIFTEQTESARMSRVVI